MMHNRRTIDIHFKRMSFPSNDGILIKKSLASNTHNISFRAHTYISMHKNIFGNSIDVCPKLHSLFIIRMKLSLILLSLSLTHTLFLYLPFSLRGSASLCIYICVCMWVVSGYICHFPFSTTLNLVPSQFLYYTLFFYYLYKTFPLIAS